MILSACFLFLQVYLEAELTSKSLSTMASIMDGTKISTLIHTRIAQNRCLFSASSYLHLPLRKSSTHHLLVCKSSEKRLWSCLPYFLKFPQTHHTCPTKKEAKVELKCTLVNYICSLFSNHIDWHSNEKPWYLGENGSINNAQIGDAINAE
jgi:hypothetical protein